MFVIVKIFLLLIWFLQNWFGEGRGLTAAISSPFSRAQSIWRIRGGSNVETEPTPQNVRITVTTTVGSSFLNKKKKFILPLSTKISELKEQIHLKFPGSPPNFLQRLFVQGELLSNESATLADILSADQDSSFSTGNPTMPIILDMITGTASYQKNFTVSQSLEAYAATVVQLAYIGDKLRSVVSSSESSPPSALIETIYYHELFDMVNQSLYEKYSEEISAALEREKNPEYDSPDTSRWRSSTASEPLNPIMSAIAKEFDLNSQSFKSYLFYSLMLFITARLGTPDDTDAMMILACIPILWISKFRQLRLLTKIVKNSIFALLSQVEALTPLFPATLQVISQQMEYWFAFEKGEETESKLEESIAAH